VAKLASEICGTPIAVVNLIGDGRQFFKAETGLGVRSTPLGSSFCAKAILENEFLVVPDATKDPRFDCNPLVTGEPGLRFYAGALLKTVDGHAIGTVCVLDFVPRTLSGTQERTLRVLAHQVMKQLELRLALSERDAAVESAREASERNERRLREMNAMLEGRVEERTRERDLTWSVSQDLIVVLDARGVIRAVSPIVSKILGWTPEDFVGSPVFDFIHPDDWEPSVGALRHATKSELPTFENRYRHKDGSYRWLSWVAAPEGDLIYATGRHVTAEKEQAEALRSRKSSSGSLRRWKLSGSSPAGSRTTSTTCSPGSRAPWS
jgi:PAS domain S-box-containing protein